jgi:hypothetical protein
MRRPLLMLIGVLTLEQGKALADQCTGPQLGTWRLLSFTSKDPQTGETTAPYGLYPTGFLSYTPDCRMYQIIVREHRTAPAAVVATPAEASTLFEGLISYSGTYTINKVSVSHHVDVSWNEAATGTVEVLQFRIEGNTLYTESPPARNLRDGKVTSDSLIWTKMQ